MAKLGHQGASALAVCQCCQSGGPELTWSPPFAGLNNLLKGFETNAATAVCTFGYCAGPDAEPLLFVGETRGKIVPPRGPPVFGWDAIFEPEEGSGKTYVATCLLDKAAMLTLRFCSFAEMEADEKNAISHRYRALDKLRSYLLSEQGQTEVAQT